MNRTAIAATLTCAAAFCTSAWADLPREEYRAEKSRIEAQAKTARSGCDSLAGNAKDICVEQAKGDEKVAKAELEYRNSNKPADMAKVEMAKAEASYEVAKERCDDLGGNEKDVCNKKAKADRTKAEADAKAGKKTAKAVTAATDDKLDADYKVAREKCDTLSGDAKNSCVDTAKRTYGK